jgi:hypothetical protein
LIIDPLWDQFATLLPEHVDTTRWAATAPASPTGSASTSWSRSWCSAAPTSASLTTPARRGPCAAAARE